MNILRAEDAVTARPNLLTDPIELAGNWGDSIPFDVLTVVSRMREACLADVALLSDHQPAHLRVEDHAGGYPSVWLHSENPTTGWVIVNIGARDWCKLSYQFGHELGHVLANSWQPDAAPHNPCQWLEEAVVEAFSLRGLTRLALGWERNPPFPNDAAFGAAIRAYRDQVLQGSAALGVQQGMKAGFHAWFQQQQAFLETHGAVDAARGAVPTLFGLLESDPAMVADIGALNRWPGRSSIPLHDYLAHWTQSCADLHAPGQLPARLKALFADR